MPRYTVASPLKHDGKDYRIGSAVSMAQESAALLLEQGVLEAQTAVDQVEDMTVAQLTEALGKLKVEIPAGSKKSDLVELYNTATSAVND